MAMSEDKMEASIDIQALHDETYKYEAIIEKLKQDKDRLIEALEDVSRHINAIANVEKYNIKKLLLEVK